MNDPEAIRILLVEDSATDAELILHRLRELSSPIEARRVASETELRRQLEAFTPDLILSDFSMPGFDGHQALRIAREVAPEVPFLFVSGTIGEETAIEALQSGADDYVLKDNLSRLPSSAERALRSASERRARVQAERALRASEERFRSLVETTEDWIWEVDRDGRLIYSNRGIERLLGHPLEEVLGRDFIVLLAEDEREATLEALQRHAAEGCGWSGWTLRWQHRDGGLRLLESNARPLLDDDGRLVGWRGIDRDVTARVEQEKRIGQLARIHAVLAALGDSVLRSADRQQMLDQSCRIAVEQGGFSGAWIRARVNGGKVVVLSEFTAVQPGDIDLSVLQRLRETDPSELLSTHALEQGRYLAVADVGRSELPRNKRVLLLATGVRSLIALPLGSGPWGVLTLYNSVPHEFDAEEIALLERLAATIDFALDHLRQRERLNHLAYHNPLTDLPNRAALRERLAARPGEAALAVAQIEVPALARHMEARGRDFGDALLRAIGERLQRLLDPGMELAHPAESAFSLVLPAGIDAEADRGRVQALLEQCFGKPFAVGGNRVHADYRCAVVRAPEHGTSPEEIESNLALALAEAAARGLRVAVYDATLRTRIERRTRMEQALREALRRKQFALHLQPKFDARSARLIGAEALLRWNWPEEGAVPPVEFVPLLEETGLIVPVGHWVLEEALAIGRRWRRRGFAGFRIAVNLSVQQMRQEDFAADCRALIEAERNEAGIDLEITESMLMDDIDHSVRCLHALREAGCGISIDDFGTGYSSLNYLSRLPADEIKIDRSFVAAMTTSPESLALVTNIINLAHTLDLKVVAEGVEEEEQAKLLRLLRCDSMQGYLFGRPVTAAEFERLYLDG